MFVAAFHAGEVCRDRPVSGREIFTDPTKTILLHGPKRNVPLPMEPTAIRDALANPDPAIDLAVSLVALHALRTAQALLTDRILYEVEQTGGDLRCICDLFGIGIETALHYAGPPLDKEHGNQRRDDANSGAGRLSRRGSQ